MQVRIGFRTIGSGYFDRIGNRFSLRLHLGSHRFWLLGACLGFLSLLFYLSLPLLLQATIAYSSSAPEERFNYCRNRTLSLT